VKPIDGAMMRRPSPALLRIRSPSTVAQCPRPPLRTGERGRYCLAFCGFGRAAAVSGARRL